MEKQPVLPIHLIAGPSADFPGKIRRSNYRTCQAFQTGNSEPYNKPVPLKTARWKCKSAARALSLSKLPPTARGSQRHTPPAPRTCVKQKDGRNAGQYHTEQGYDQQCDHRFFVSLHVLSHPCAFLCFLPLLHTMIAWMMRDATDIATIREWDVNSLQYHSIGSNLDSFAVK